MRSSRRRPTRSPAALGADAADGDRHFHIVGVQNVATEMQFTHPRRRQPDQLGEPGDFAHWGIERGVLAKGTGEFVAEVLALEMEGHSVDPDAQRGGGQHVGYLGPAVDRSTEETTIPSNPAWGRERTQSPTEPWEACAFHPARVSRPVTHSVFGPDSIPVDAG